MGYDAGDDALEISEYFCGRNANSLETALRNQAVAALVSPGAIAALMRLAIYLKRKPCLEAGEIQ